MVEVKGQRRFTIGEVAERAGVATSALRFYEEHGLIQSERNESGHRRYHPDVLRRVSFIRIAQRVGLSLAEVAE
ncbi:MAG: MerR family DNA-binding transcriptional regulator, partial [Ilumatobacter fluminis]